MPKGALSDAAYPVAKISPQQLAIGSSADTGWVNIGAQNGRVTFVLNVGTVSSTGTVDMSIQQATSSAGAGAKALSPAKAITQLTTTGDLAVVNVRADELDVAGGFCYVRAKVIDGTAAAYVSVTALGDPSATPPGVTAPVTQVVGGV